MPDMEQGPVTTHAGREAEPASRGPSAEASGPQRRARAAQCILHRGVRSSSAAKPRSPSRSTIDQ
ncbi:hypothetical protein BFW01_g4137 [Lasiodiplodia theobromae]|nr:hypothetical protein BFW01_g4137 [Lasiodiplodia theobromae]